MQGFLAVWGGVCSACRFGDHACAGVWWEHAVYTLPVDTARGDPMMSERFPITSDVSERYVAGLDRTPLGRFAVPADVLTAMDELQRLPLYRGYVKNMDMVLTGRLSDSILMRDADFYPLFHRVDILCKESGTDYYTARTELLFWWLMSFEGEVGREGTRELLRDTGAELIKLNAVYTNPSMHDYFAVGIWDTDFIGRCMTDGVDASLAVTLLPSL